MLGEKELLVASFGTSYNESRAKTIGAIEEALKEAFPDYSVCRGFTSGMIVKQLRERDGIRIDTVREALEQAAAAGVRTLLVQPTHMMSGFEYQDLRKEIEGCSGRFERIVLGEPLLASEEDFDVLLAAIIADTAEFDDGRTAICFMGHGTQAESNRVYAALQKKLAEKGFFHYYIGTVEANPTLGDLVEKVGAGNYTRVVLQPLMIVAGDHANNDMAGAGKDSWKSVFEAHGYEVLPVLRGLGELPAIQQLFVRHAREAAERLYADRIYI